MSVKNWRFSYSKEGKIKLKQNILDTVSLWGAIGLLWFSFVTITGEHFPTFLQTQVLVSKPQLDATSLVGPEYFQTIGIDLSVIGAFVFFLWLGYDWPRQYLRRLEIPCRLIGMAIPVVYVIHNLQQISDGMISIVATYLPFVNNYYKTRFGVFQEHSNQYLPIALTAICMLLWWMVWLIAYAKKNRVLLVLFPMFALAIELLVGLSPHGPGLLYAFFAAMLLLLLGGSFALRKVVVLACVGLSVVLSSIWFKTDIEKLATLDAKQSLLRWQNNAKLRRFNPFQLFQMDLHANGEELNNNAPEYTGEIILEIEADEMPSDTVYLKGFYGTRYEDGNWVYDDAAFTQACKDAGRDPEEVAELIFQMPYERGYELEQQQNTVRNITYKIYYTGTAGNVAYAPYLSDYSTADEAYAFLGDYLLKKSIVDSTIEISGINMSQSIDRWRTINACIQMAYGGHTSLDVSSYWYSAIDLRDQKEELEFLNAFSKNYLELPEDTTYLDEALEFIDATTDFTEYKYNIETDGENYRRLLYAEMTAKYLDMRMEYSLKLDNLPADKDPIEHALNTSYEGYCMHFASAATLLLRKAGVPARYVSGYTINPNLFVLDQETGTYKVNVADYMAHAWVEIYLDNIGWVSVEMTPGSSLTALPTTEQINQWESESNENRDIWNRVETPSESEDSQTQDSETETQDSEDQETEENTQAQQDTQNRPQNNPDGLGGGFGKSSIDTILKVLGMLGAFVGVGLAAFFYIRYGKNRYEAVLEREMEKNMTRRAVKRMNRRLYYTLRMSNASNWFGRKWTDLAYRDALVERFTDVSADEWDRYMDIVKKNHYSKEAISTEEMQYCYDCYKKVRLIRINRREKR